MSCSRVGVKRFFGGVWELIGSRKDRWGKKSQEEMAKRKQLRALEQEREARRGERREEQRAEGEEGGPTE